MNWEIFLRLLLAGTFGAVIGFERTSKKKEAGIRTHFLVALGSALIMVVSKYGFGDILHLQDIALDPSRIAAQVVSGIGFIGAGMIIFQRESVRGLTTAAGLWATAGIGLAVGAGMYWISLSATILVFVCLEFLHSGFGALNGKYSKLTVHITEGEAIQEVLRTVTQNHMNMSTMEYREETDPKSPLAQPGKSVFILELELKPSSRQNITELFNEVRNIAGVGSVRLE